MLVSSSLHLRRTLNKKTFCKDACKEILTGQNRVQYGTSNTQYHYYSIFALLFFVVR